MHSSGDMKSAYGHLEKLAAVPCCASLVGEDVIWRSGAMGQLGFFDAEKRPAALSEKGDPLEAIAARGRVFVPTSRRWC